MVLLFLNCMTAKMSLSWSRNNKIYQFVRGLIQNPLLLAFLLLSLLSVYIFCFFFLASLYARIRPDFKLFREACPPALVRTPASTVRSSFSDLENVVIQYEGSSQIRIEWKSQRLRYQGDGLFCLNFMTAKNLPPWSAKEEMYPFKGRAHSKSLVLFILALIICC